MGDKKWQIGVARGAVSCHLLSDRKSASFVLTIFTETKRNTFLNFKANIVDTNEEDIR